MTWIQPLRTYFQSKRRKSTELIVLVSCLITIVGDSFTHVYSPKLIYLKQCCVLTFSTWCPTVINTKPASKSGHQADTKGHQALRVKGRENMPNSFRMCKVGKARKQNFDYSYVTLHEECPSTEFLLICIFPYSDWIRRGTLYLSVFSPKYLSVFSPNTRKYGPEKTTYLDTFHAA